MKLLIKSILIGAAVAVIAFAGVFLREYSYLSAHQPPNQAGLPMPPDVTSAPPSAAILPAALWAVLSFFCTSIIFFIGSKIYGKNNASH
jgi:hypothetical protein